MEFIFKRAYHGPVKAVIFDWAGTAVDFGSFAPTIVFQRLFERRGVSISLEDARSGMGLMKKDHLRKILEQPAVRDNWKFIHGTYPDEEDLDFLFDEFSPMQISVITEFSDPIPGLLDVMNEVRSRNILVGTTTGYLRSMMDLLAPAAAKKGYFPDCIICPNEVPTGRPAPWMCFQNALQLGVYPMEAIIKIGDSIPDIEEGLNAGMWSIGISLTGTLVGKRENEINELSFDDKKNIREKAVAKLIHAGAHDVIDGIWDFPNVLNNISDKLARGEKP